MTEKPVPVEHLENDQVAVCSDLNDGPTTRHDVADLSQEHVEPSSETSNNCEFDEKRNKRFNRRLDIRLLPLCCWLYLLNFLDRGNIGNARILNNETGDDLMTRTGTTSQGYAITLTLFSVAYAVFEVPSNWVMKHHVRPSVWLAILLCVEYCNSIPVLLHFRLWSFT